MTSDDPPTTHDPREPSTHIGPVHRRERSHSTGVSARRRLVGGVFVLCSTRGRSVLFLAFASRRTRRRTVWTVSAFGFVDLPSRRPGGHMADPGGWRG